MGKKDVKFQEYFFTYYAQKMILLNHFYPHVESIIPEFTDHGPSHIVRILELYQRILRNNVPGLAETQEVVDATSLNFYELYLLLSATVWHDVGNLLGREQHNKKIIQISNKLKKNFFVDKDVQKYALQIAKAHTGVNGVRQEILSDDTNYMNKEINLRFLGAVLRFTDELEEGEVRIDKDYYETMKNNMEDRDKLHWETSCCIKRVEPDADEGIVSVHAQIKKEELFKVFKEDGKKIALIDALIFRVNKMNLERINYMQFVRKHIEYREIVFDLTVENSRLKRITFRFNNDQGYDQFWSNCPHIDPRKHIKSYVLQKMGD
jgi:hypothetical protein